MPTARARTPGAIPPATESAVRSSAATCRSGRTAGAPGCPAAGGVGAAPTGGADRARLTVPTEGSSHSGRGRGSEAPWAGGSRGG